MKKLIKNNIFIDFINIIIKFIIAILGNSRSLLADSLFNVSTLSKKVFVGTNKKESKNINNIISIIIGAIIVFMGTSLIFDVFISKSYKSSWYVLVISIILILFKNLSNSYIYADGFNSNEKMITSNRDYTLEMIIPWLVVVSYLISKLSNVLEIFKYSDSFVAVIISLLNIFIGIKLIVFNFRNLANDLILDEKALKENISKISLIKSINKFKLINYGGLYKINLDISIDKDIDSVKAYPNILGLCTTIFKTYSNIEIIELSKSPYKERRIVKNARNSRSRNSKTNPKKKNTKKKNSKR